MFVATDFFDAERRLIVHHPRANVPPRNSCREASGFVNHRVTDARQSMLALSIYIWAISGSENKVKLSSASSHMFERSSCSDDKHAPRIEQHSI